MSSSLIAANENYIHARSINKEFVIGYNFIVIVGNDCCEAKLTQMA